MLTLLDASSSRTGTTQPCSVAKAVTGMTGAGITLMIDAEPQASLCNTDTASSIIEDLQFAVGEGPSIDAYKHERPVLEPCLRDPASVRWPAFSGPAIDAGVRAVFAFPLRTGGVRLGALTLYRDEPGDLTGGQHADALVMAGITTTMILLQQSGAPPDQLAAELEAGADLHYVVHQASGMVAAQMGVGVGEALVRLRGHAFGRDRPLVEVAEDVVGRRLRFEDRSDDGLAR